MAQRMCDMQINQLENTEPSASEDCGSCYQSEALGDLADELRRERVRGDTLYAAIKSAHETVDNVVDTFSKHGMTNELRWLMEACTIMRDALYSEAL